MNENFDRAPGAGRSRNFPADPGLMTGAGDADSKTPLFNQREPLRQPRTTPPFTENSIGSVSDIPDGGTELSSSSSANVASCIQIRVFVILTQWQGDLKHRMCLFECKYYLVDIFPLGSARL